MGRIPIGERPTRDLKELTGYYIGAIVLIAR